MAKNEEKHCSTCLEPIYSQKSNKIFSSFHLGLTKGKRCQVQSIQNEPRKAGDGEYKCDLCFVEGDKKGAFHEKRYLIKHQRKCHPEDFPKSEYICDLCFVEGGKKGIFYEKNIFLKHQIKSHPERFSSS